MNSQPVAGVSWHVTRRVMMTVPLVLSLLAGCGLAGAEATAIPKGFLLTESRATAPRPSGTTQEDWWKVGDSTSWRLELNPCEARRTSYDGRVAMRTITHLNSGPGYESEQLVLYRTAVSAHDAFRELRSEVRTCPRKGSPSSSKVDYGGRLLRLGDEAMMVGRYFMRDGTRRRGPGRLWIVARRGAALFLYTSDEVPEDPASLQNQLTGQAREMAVKVCGLPGVCG
ncbi:hypothetical protein ACFQSB_09490 [Sphaerisporangium rhizosphaerae]|uniref:Sensor domain-containing protein n=2 Tax=Sphaerisporangium rhizosphaerae TaxID=2269375 RepID=A0ABW2P3P8_9ACTN